jgi:hypothetical protein
MSAATRFAPIAAIVALAAMSCSDPPKVVQGTVVSYEQASKDLSINDDSTPPRALTLSLEGADVGAEPAKGNVVRVAYRERGGKLVASRVMNITKQKELFSGGGH